MKVLGIDPGAEGALALLREDGSIIRVVDMPCVQIRIGKTEKARVDPAGVVVKIRDLNPDHVCLEQVGAMQHDSPFAAFTFGHSAGIVAGVVAALGLPVTFVRPQAWRKAMGVSCPGGSTHAQRKEASRQRVLQLYPLKAALFARKLDSDRSEAVLIGRWFCLANGLMQERAAA